MSEESGIQHILWDISRMEAGKRHVDKKLGDKYTVSKAHIWFQICCHVVQFMSS